MTGVIIDELDTAASTAEALVTHRLDRLRVGCERLLLAAKWCDLHPVVPGGRGQQVGCEGNPRVALFAAEELSCLLQVHPHAARTVMADALNLRHRHPRLWSRIEALELTDWVAVKTARMASAAELTTTQARWVDAQTADQISTLPVGRYLALVEAKIIEADQAAAEARRETAMLERFVRKTQLNEHGIKGIYARAVGGDINYFYAAVDRVAQILELQGDDDTLDVRRSKALAILATPERALELFAWAEQHTTRPGAPGAPEAKPAPSTAPRPPATIHVHVSAEAVAAGFGIARIEDIGPVALAAIRELLGHTHVTIKPVVDLTANASVDRYEIPTWMKDIVEERFPFEVFPYGTITGRRADKDHTVPYDPHGPPDQTSVDNLAPLGRRAHRIKTFGSGWRHIRVGPRDFLWRTPTGYWYRVDPDGTQPLGQSISLLEQHFQTLLRAA